MDPKTPRILFLTGATHSGKTLLADRLMKRYCIPVFSLDLLKMGLIRSGRTALTPYDPWNWADSFTPEERGHIFAAALVMTPAYIEAHYDDILRHAQAAEKRMGPPPTKEELLAEHRKTAEMAARHGFHLIRIEKDYRPDYRFPR